jgi:hypothetical protein
MVTIRRVVLYKHGVGYFEREGKVSGNATVELQFRQSEMNDVLKSLTALDRGGGAVTSVSYDSSEPLSKKLEEIAIRLPDANVLTGLMSDLKGAAVAATVAGRSVKGTVVGVETLQAQRDGVILPRHRLAILVDGRKLQNFDLMEVQSLAFEDEKLRRDLGHLLETLIGSKKKDRRKLSIFAKGKGSRDLSIGYVVETPVWKTSYRFLLDSKEKQKPIVQGWAIVDNTQDEDWDDVELTLIAGLPVSFVHDLYSARYKRRPVVEVDEEEAYGPPMMEMALEASEAAGEGAERDSEVAPPAGMPRAMRQERGRAVETVRRQIEAGDLYAYQIKDPVTVKRGQSALVPILSSNFEGRRVAVYNRSVREENPMAAILFTNTTGMTLEGGPLTVLEGDDYVGESMMETAKEGERRILPFSVELGCRIHIDGKSSNQPVYHCSIQSGTLYLRYYRVQETIYKIHNRSGRKLDLILEHPFLRGWDLVDTPEPFERTENLVRFRFEVAERGDSTFTVRERSEQVETHAISGLGAKQLTHFAHSGYLDGETEKRIRQAIETQERIAEAERELADLNRQVKAIHQNQERLRKNLQVLGDREEETRLRQRYVGQLEAEEDRVNELQRRVEGLHEEKEKLADRLAEQIGSLRYDRKLR